MKIVILGNGIAGITVAARLREIEPDPQKVQVEIYTREAFEYYSRIRLPEVFTGGIDIDDIELYSPSWYERHHLHVFKNMEAVRIDPRAKRVEFRNGSIADYDRLVLAIGADSARPAIPNAELDGVFTVREYGDADAVRKYVGAATTSAVVIGGGLLGLEAAHHLLMPQVSKLTIIEASPRLLPRQLDEDAAELLLERVTAWPARVILSGHVAEFLGDRRVTGVRLSTGETVEAHTVLLATGIAPRIAIARDAGLTVDRGVVVDLHLRSSDPDIFVAGDLVEYAGIVWGIIPAAIDHAPVVANNVLGLPPIAYHQTVPRNTLKVAGVTLTSMGKVVLADDELANYTVLSATASDRSRFEKYVIRDGKLVGCILLGSTDHLGLAQKNMMHEVQANVIRDLLAFGERA